MSAWHDVDYDDEQRRWACSCGHTAATLAAVRRHARAANLTVKGELTPDGR